MTGGDSVQVTKTKEAMERSGVAVDTLCKRPLDEYDIVHLFNLITPDTYLNWSAMRKKGIPTVISPIYWPMDEFLAKGWCPSGYRLADPILRSAFRRKTIALMYDRVRNTARAESDQAVAQLRRKAANPETWKTILSSCRMVLPNSEAEAAVLMRRLGVKQEKMITVPNGVSDTYFCAESKDSLSSIQKRNHILSVARIEDRKNSLRLIKAASKIAIPLTLIGHSSMNSPYMRSCQHAARKGEVRFVSQMETESPGLISAYADASVHALVSWFETPGLSSLEAAAAGCRIVTTDRGSTREYFGDLVHYADPSDVGSIARAIENALEDKEHAQKRRLLKERLLKYYTWENAARMTIKGYERALSDE